jgi:hypothetical protein
MAGCCECGDKPSGSCATELGLVSDEVSQSIKPGYSLTGLDCSLFSSALSVT